ncbi:MAG: arsenical pump rane protein [Chlorobi bacterium]|nr:arsenical pump rane protein [Chlorobiota bacterium]
MQEATAYLTVLVTLGLVVARPRIGPVFRITPAISALAGVLFMFMLGIVKPMHWVMAVTNLWSPFVALVAIMVITEVARRAGLLEWWASIIESRATSTSRLLLLVFGLGVLTSTAFNNDAAILLLTPVVVALVQHRYPGRPDMVPLFAFAVFLSAGVAALPVSNPMNMVVAEFLHISFNEYARHMIPVAVAGWIIAFVLLRLVFARQVVVPIKVIATSVPRSTTVQRMMMGLLLCVLVSYPLFGSMGGPVWAVAGVGALLSFVLARQQMKINPTVLLRTGVSWETLVFLLAVLVMSFGLRDVGLVDRLAALYRESGFVMVGIASAIGSALLNNHPMSHLNMMALDTVAPASHLGVFAALVGGDLGPRLLPMGSLAGLIWIEMLRRYGVNISVGRFALIGLVVAVPTIAISLLILSFYSF